MNVNPSNPVVRNAIEKAIQDECDSLFSCHDYENGKIGI